MTLENESRDVTGAAGEDESKGTEGLAGEKKTDDSWKEKARKEKEKLADHASSEAPPMPPASFLGLIEEYYLRTMMALGQFPNPVTGDLHFDLGSAKYAIDTLTVLEEKTKGNLDPEEKTALKEVLHKLRMGFVHLSKSPPDLTAPQDAEAQPPPDGEAPAGEEPKGAGPKIII